MSNKEETKKGRYYKERNIKRKEGKETSGKERYQNERRRKRYQKELSRKGSLRYLKDKATLHNAKVGQLFIDATDSVGTLRVCWLGIAAVLLHSLTVHNTHGRPCLVPSTACR